jgi:hypothetical protein
MVVLDDLALPVLDCPLPRVARSAVWRSRGWRRGGVDVRAYGLEGKEAWKRVGVHTDVQTCGHRALTPRGAEEWRLYCTEAWRRVELYTHVKVWTRRVVWAA